MDNGGFALLVDDNDAASSVAQMMLEFIGYEVDLAQNGRIATEMAAQTDYVVILMDIEMPEMDGLAATKIIRQKEIEDNLPTVPILGMSGHSSQAIKVLCQLAGMNDFLLKPFLIVDLEEKLKPLMMANRTAAG